MAGIQLRLLNKFEPSQWKEDMREFSSLLKIFIEEPSNSAIYRELFGESVRRGPALLDFRALGSYLGLPEAVPSAFQFPNSEPESDQPAVEGGCSDQDAARPLDDFQALIEEFTLVKCPFCSSKEAKPLKKDLPAHTRHRGPYRSFWIRKIDSFLQPQTDLSQVTNLGLYSRDEEIFGRNLRGDFLRAPQFQTVIEVVRHLANNIHAEHCALL